MSTDTLVTPTNEMTKEELLKYVEEFGYYDDPKAPYGYDKDGNPNAPLGFNGAGIPAKPRGRRPGAKSGTASAPKKSTRPKSTNKSGTDYTEGIARMLQMVAFPLTIIGNNTNNTALIADGATLAMNTPPISEAVNKVAQERPEVAAVLDKIMQVGPYGELIGAIVPLVFQIGVNHKLLPNNIPGTVPAEKLLEQVQQP